MITISIKENVFENQSDKLYTSILVNDHEKQEIKYMYISQPYTREDLAKALRELADIL